MSDESRCIAHEQCPACAKIGRDSKGDNLGVYDDDHKYCFSCGYYSPPTLSKLNLIFNKTKEIEETTNQDLALPEDVTTTIDWQALTWLEQYSITRADILKHRILWSPKRLLLIFPIFSENNTLLMWQGRSFDPLKKYKWFTKGKPEEIFHIIEPPSNYPALIEALVVVEDIVSAIKVGQIIPCMPLFGSHLSRKRLNRLAAMYNKLIIWLDYDKTPMAYKYEREAKIFGMDSFVVQTILDPKAQTMYNIRDILWRHNLFHKAKEK